MSKQMLQSLALLLMLLAGNASSADEEHDVISTLLDQAVDGDWKIANWMWTVKKEGCPAID